MRTATLNGRKRGWPLMRTWHRGLWRDWEKLTPEQRWQYEKLHETIQYDKQLDAMKAAWVERRKKYEIKPASESTRRKMSASAKKRDRSAGYSETHKQAIQAGLKRFWEQRREAGLPLRHPRGRDSER